MSPVNDDLRDLAPDPEERRRQRIIQWLGIGVPSLVGGIIALLLGMPWWIVAGFLAVVAAIVLSAG